MMAFRIVRGGYEARASADERQMIQGLARDVIYMLGSEVDEEIERRNSTDDVDPLEAFEAEVAGIAESIEEEEEGVEREFSMPADNAIEALLPDMSEDPDLANELRSLTEDSVASSKIDNLVTFYLGLNIVPASDSDASTDADERIGYGIFVPNEDAQSWLSAMNDIRLVLAARLGINDDAAAEAVYQRAGYFTGTMSRRNPDELPTIETSEDMMAVLYGMLTWWQESLIGAVRNKALRR